MGFTGGGELIFEADVKGGVGMGSESHSCFAGYVFGFSVFISNGIFNLIPVYHQWLHCLTGVHTAIRTCMLTICPSPFCPLTIAVTSTRVSLATKFRMHRSYLLEWPVCAWRSNLRAEEKGRAARKRRVLAAEPMRTILATTIESRKIKQTAGTTTWTATDCRKVKVLLRWTFGFSNRKLTSLLRSAWRAKSASPS